MMARHRHFLPVTVLILLIGFAFSPALFGGRVLFDSDTLTYDYPLFLLFSEALHDGQTLQWNPYYLMGYPSEVSPVGGSFDRINQTLTSITGNPLLSYHLRMAGMAIVGVIFAYCFGIEAGLSRAASFILAAAYFTGQTLAVFSSALVNAGAFFVLPMFLWLILSFRKGKSFVVIWIAGSTLLFWGILGGFTQTVFYSVVIALGYALYVDILTHHANLLVRFRATLGLILVSGTAAVAAFPFLLDTIYFREITLRTAGFGLSRIDGLLAGDLITFVLPDYLRLPFLTSNLNLGLYIGGLPILFALFSLFWFRDRAILFFLGGYTVILLLLVEPLGISRLIQHLPVFSSFHTLRRWLLPGVFLLASLAAFGFERLRLAYRGTGKISQFYVYIVSTIAVLVSLIAVGFNILLSRYALSGSFWQEKIPDLFFGVLGENPAILASEHYRDVFTSSLSQVASSFSLKNWEFALPLFLLVLGALLIVSYARKYISEMQFTGAAVSLVVFNFIAVFGAQFNDYIPREEYLIKPRVAEAILTDGGKGRLISFLTGEALFREVQSGRVLTPEENFTFSRELLFPNLNMVHHIPRADGYEPFIARRQHHVWRTVVANEDFVAGAGSDWAAALDEKKRTFLELLPLLSSYGVEYVLSGYSLESPHLAELPVPFQGSEFQPFLYRNTAVRPYVFIPQSVNIVSEWDDTLFTQISREENLAVIECTACQSEMHDGGGEIRELRQEIGYSEFNVMTEKGAWVLVSVSHLPGWGARIDGEVAPIHAANYLLQAVYVPKGIHKVAFSYRPIGWGKALKDLWRD